MQYSIAHAACNMQKRTACPNRAVASCTCSKDKDTKDIKFSMHTCHAEFTCRAHEGRMVQKKYNIDAPDSCGMGNSALCWLLL